MDKTNTFRRLLRQYLGSLRYTPPGFLADLNNNPELKSKIRKSTRRILIVALGTIILAIMLLGLFYLWKEIQPEKIKLWYEVTIPEPPSQNTDPLQPLKIHFHGSAAPKESAGKEIFKGISIHPELDGQWKWESDRTIEFLPASSWGIGVHYTISMGKELFPSHISVSPLKIRFSTPVLKVRLNESSFYIDPTDETVKRVLATLNFNYPVDPASVANFIQIHPDIKADSGTFLKKSYKFNLEFGEENRKVYIVSEPLGDPLVDIQMKVEINPGIRSSQNDSTIENPVTTLVTIPGISTFAKIGKVEFKLVKDENQLFNQLIVVSTEGEVSSSDMAKNMEIWLLPRDRPDLPGLKGKEKVDWEREGVDMVVPKVLDLSEKIRFASVPTEREYSSLNSYTLQVKPYKYLYVKIKQGTPFYGGYYLSSDFETILQVNDYPKELSFVSEGNVLSLSGSKQLSLFSRGVRTVYYQIHRIMPDDINHLVSQSNGNLSNFRFSNWRFSIDNISKKYNGKISLRLPSSREVAYFSLDMAPYLATIPDEHLRYGLFSLEIGENPPKDNGDFRAFDRRLVMITDLGLFVKQSRDGSKDVYVQSIATGKPMQGVSIQILGKNGIPVSSRHTDSLGHVSFPFLRLAKKENTPTAYVAILGNDLSFLPYEAPGRFLDYSDFDTGGVYNSGNPKQLTAQVFSDRGIYRPGDSVNGALIVKAGRWENTPVGSPLVLLVRDPRGQLFFEKDIWLSGEGFNEFNFETFPYSPTGRYSIDLYLVNEEKHRVFLDREEISVEEFLPDRLRVSTAFNHSSKGWVTPDNLAVEVVVNNLYGTPSVGNKVISKFSLKAASLFFRQYREYQFLQPEQEPISYSEEMENKKTDDEGRLFIPIPLDKFGQGAYRILLSVDVYEKTGGRSVGSETQVLVSSLNSLVGYKADGDLSYIQKGSERQVELIAINPELEKIPLKEASFQLSILDYISTLVKQPNGVYQYQSVEKKKLLSTTPFEIAGSGTTLSLNTSSPGKYVAEVLDSGGGVVSRFNYTIVGDSNLAGSLNRSATLDMKLNKSDYSSGETIEVSITAPYPGSGLISIEQDKVFSHKWFQSSTLSSVQTIKIPRSGLEGNAYVSVAYIRSPDSKEIFMSPLSFGVVPFNLDKEKRTQNIVLDYPEEIEPGKTLTIRYSTNKKGKIIIYAVDEGILQVGNYTLPDPLAYFFRKRALEVKTAQILDLVLPDYSVVKEFSAMGGGMSESMLASNLNPFNRKRKEPVTFWSGILDSGPRTRSVSYRVPDYFNGSIRIMAVCVSEDALGSTEDFVLARSTFIIQPSAPLVAVEGDVFSFQATVGNNLKNSGENAQVRISLKGDVGLVLPESQRTLTIPEGRDSVVEFPVEVGKTLGSRDLTITASSGGKSSSIVHSLSLRPIVPYRTDLISGIHKKGSKEIPVERNMYSEFRTLEVSASYLPLGLAKGTNFYLDEYPYTCTEQLTSKAFPRLYPGFVKNLNLERDEVEQQLASSIAILLSRQKNNGGFGQWTSKSPSIPIIDLYVFHFLLEARKKGIFIPNQMLEGAEKQAVKYAEMDVSSIEQLRLKANAIFLLTYSGKTTTRYLEDIRKVLEETQIDWKSDLIGVHLASSYNLLQMKNQARSILWNIKRNLTKRDFEDGYNDKLSYISQYLHALALYDRQKLITDSSDLLDAIATEMGSFRFTTFSASMALVAIQSYVDATEKSESTTIEVVQQNQNGDTIPLELVGNSLKTAGFDAETESIVFSNNSMQPLYYQVLQAGFNKEVPESEQKNGVEILREFQDEDGKNVKSMTLGETYTVKISVRSLLKDSISNMAIVDLLPACLEPDLDTRDGDWGRGSFKENYVDRREDRVVLYGTVDTKITTFSYPVKAVYPGRFKVPPIYGEAMYDNAVWAMSKASELLVEE